ncbi:multidrug ABC transporter [Paenibacillus sp. FSL H7-0357]|uniref:ABC transporter permease n=1 Tax=Paenibacillus sp. FSL H7-0357 TaxID=1536774 RepID=UPI0004F72E3C|nr:ABC transporter permease [Paenibacillus sp. FSL H7-0357]AIQ20447.1 multidrug ABC transporter [Paenibacillus sp. FSL H7-0357]
MQFIIMLKHQLKQIFSNRIAVLAMMGLPLILTYLFSFSTGSMPDTIYAADDDHSIYSKQLLELINQQSGLRVINTDVKSIKNKVNAQDIPFGFVIGQDFSSMLLSGQELPLSFVQNEENGEGALLKEIIAGEAGTIRKVVNDSEYMSGHLQLNADSMSRYLFTALKGASKPSINVQTLNSGEEGENKTAAERFTGFMAMFIWFVVVQGLRSLVDEKENKTVNRLLSTPVSYMKYLLSKMAAAFLFGIIYISVILLSGKYLLRINMINHNLPVLVMLLAMYLFALIGLTMLILPFMKSQKQFTSSASIIVAVTGMLGGSFFSMQLAPKVMRTIGKFTPEAWVIQVTSVMNIRDGSIGSAVIALAGIGFLGLAGAYVFMRKELRGLEG